MSRRDWFSSVDATGDLAGRSVRAGVSVLGGQGVILALNLLYTVVLARLLTPDDFGLLAMVMTLTVFAHCFRDLGLVQSTIQRASISRPLVSTLFWINAAAGVLVAVLVAALGPVIAWFFHRPELTVVTVAMSSIFVLHGLGAQHRALLERAMCFHTLTLVRIVAAVISVAAAIVAAWRGAGYWAIVVFQVTDPLVALLGTWACCRWIPSLPRRGTGVLSMVRFGGYLAGSNVLQTLVRNLDNMLIGRFFGAGPLGYYSNAYKLLMLPVTQLARPVGTVVIPALSRLQDEPDRYRAFYRRCVEVMAAAAIPVVLICLATAENLVRTVLGDQWLPSVPLFRALAPAALLEAFYVTSLWAYLSLGHTDRLFRWRLIAAVVTTIAFIIGLNWGPLGVAIAFSVAVCLLRGPEIIYCFRGTPLVIGDVLTAVWRPAIAGALAAGAVVALDVTVLAETTPMLAFAIEVVVFAVVYALGWLPVPGGRAKLMGLIRMKRHLG